MKSILILINLFVAINCQDKQWTNGRFTCFRTETTAIGEELKLGCNSVYDLGLGWGECNVYTPIGRKLMVTVDGVMDANGPVEGVQPTTSGSCGVIVSNPTEEEYFGNWLVQYSEDRIPIIMVITTDNLVTDIRLPQSIQAENYQVMLTPDLEYTGSNIRFDGNVVMSLTNVAATEVITFHADELTPIGEPVVTDENGNDLPVEAVYFDFQRTFVHLSLSSVLPTDSRFKVAVNFTADITRGAYSTYGFYPQICSETNGLDKMCWFTQFESTNARNAFPCLDEPSFKATFDMRIGRTEDYHARSNMPLKSTAPHPDPDKFGYVLDTFETSVAMSPYLVAVAITDYVTLPNTDNSTSVWAPAEDIEAGRGDFSNVIGAQIMAHYADYFNVEYPLPKQDLVYEAKKGGAMENWGLVLFAPRTLMLDADADDSAKWLVVNVVAHELAHQWFGNLVTMEWWGQTWLNEGFAVFVSYIGSEHVDPTPSLHPWDRFYVREMQRVMWSDENTRVHWPMTDETTDRGDIERKFGSFTYQKGGSIIRMIQSILSKPTFTKGITSYLNNMAYSAATEDDLFFSLEVHAMLDEKWPATNRDFTEVMKSWTNQAGLPVVHASLNSATLSVNQTWLVSDGQPPEQRTWHIPLTFTSVEESPVVGWDMTEPMEWLWQEEVSKDIDVTGVLTPDAPFVVNIQGTGYFRVNYDEDNWNKIAEILKTNKDWIHPLNRAQIVCDVARLVESGHVSTAIRDNVLSYIDTETEFGPNYAYEQCASGLKEEELDGSRFRI